MVNEKFQWERHPKAEAIIAEALDECCRKNSFIENLRRQLLKNASTNLFDWLDHVILGYSEILIKELEEAGFVSECAAQDYRVFNHPGALLPRIVVKDHDHPVIGAAISVESIADFLMVRGMSGWIEGAPLGGYRRCCVSTDNGISLWAVERRATLTMEPTYESEGYQERYVRAVELWQCRPRGIKDEEAMKVTLSLAEEIVRILGKDLAAWVVLDVERRFWQARNNAGQIQKNRQDRLGMGWANHDHHTFRSSRQFFSSLVRFFEILGFHCRERFYAGEEAGWGAQVMENSNCGLTLFLDVDLDPHELEIDFSHQPLPELDNLGTIGLWCALHGDSILKSGMHHLEAQFLFDNLKEDLAVEGINMMEPFSNFTYLKQAFTKGAVWDVDPKRVSALLEKGKITAEQAEKFLRNGAIGSHLENLQRKEGYKGFNQKNVSFIIKRTDPRSVSSQ